MFLVRRPSPDDLARFLDAARHQALTYEPVGLARSPSPSGYRVDEAQVTLGRGEATFRRATEALDAWRGFDLGWAGIFPEHPPLEAGTHLAVFARHLGFWSLHACRIVYTIRLGAGAVEEAGGSSPPREYGFAYGTLEDHAESGEETFRVRMEAQTGAVTYSIRAVSRERALLARLGAPAARAFQARFRRDSLAAMQRHVAGAAATAIRRS